MLVVMWQHGEVVGVSSDASRWLAWVMVVLNIHVVYLIVNNVSTV